MPDPQRKATIVIPSFNEGQTIGQVVTNVKEKCGHLIHEIIVVDDGSTDDTSDAAKAAGCRVIRHARKRGYGASLKTGLRAAESEFVLSMDADGQHRVEDVLHLLNPLFDPLRIFIPLSMLTGLTGILWGIPYALLGRGISVGSMLAIVTSILLFGLGLLCDQISQLRLTLFE